MTLDDDPPPALTPVVIGLTRPPTLWGVPYMAGMFIIGGTVIAWLVFNRLWALLFAPLFYLILFSACAWDARVLDILMVAGRKTPRTRNRGFWGANSYGP